MVWQGQQVLGGIPDLLAPLVQMVSLVLQVLPAPQEQLVQQGPQVPMVLLVQQAPPG